MHRRLIGLLLLLSLTAVAFGQEPPEPGPTIPLSSPPQELVPVSEPIVQTKPAVGRFAVAGADNFNNATSLTIPGGDAEVVNDFTTDVSDPDLSICGFGTMPNPKGYRTTWYTFKPTSNGLVTIDTFGSNYDTILALHRRCQSGGCELIACNDDHNGFSSQIQTPVEKDVTYYIEVADWRSGVSGNATLLISLEMEPLISQWQSVGNLPVGRTRHATAVAPNSIFAISGQTNIANNPTLTPRLDRYDENIGQWSRLADMPGTGISNSTAAFVSTATVGGGCTQGCLYVPGGFDGNVSTYSGTHWRYDLALDAWLERPNIGATLGWPDGVPFAWATAVTKPDQTGYYLLGGVSSQPAIDNTAVIHNKAYFFNAQNSSWNDNPPDLNEARFGLMATMLTVNNTNKLCVIGGIENDGGTLVLTPNGECWQINGGTTWNPIAPLNIPRYGAGSAVGPDGQWYVFGGSDANHQALSSVEVYDPTRDVWSLQDITYDLGATGGSLARAWPRGGFVQNNLYAVGGNGVVQTGNNVQYPIVPSLERLFVATFETFMPIAQTPYTKRPDDTLKESLPIGFNQPVIGNFDTQLDYFDVYRFDLPTTDRIHIRLSEIATGSDFDMYLYDNDKLLRSTANNPNNIPEAINITLEAGRYYVMIERVLPFGLPNGEPYRFVIEK